MIRLISVTSLVATLFAFLPMTPLRAATLLDNQPLVAGTAVFDAFDTLGGTRTLNFATIYLDVEAEVDFDPISNFGTTAATVEVEQDVTLSWAPDDSAYHSEPTDFGLATVTINSGPFNIPAGDTLDTSVTHVLPTQSYEENIYDFDEQYGVLLLSAITNFSVTGSGLFTSFGASMDLSGDVTVEYDYTVAVPEPTSVAMLALTGIVGMARKRRR